MPTVRVWDPFVRVFHWSLVGLFALALATGDEIEWLHLAAGYAIAALVVLRTAWGFVGPRHARFSDFVRPPGAVLGYLRDALRLRAPRHLGHNPAGGAAVAASLREMAPRPTHLIAGMLNTKDVLGYMRALAGVARSLTAVEIPGEAATLPAATMHRSRAAAPTRRMSRTLGSNAATSCP